MTKSPNINLLDAQHNPFEDDDGTVHVKTTHEIPSLFLDNLAEKRLISSNERCKDFHHVASIPAGVAAAMYRAGLDIYRAPPNDIIKWLRNNGYEHFFATAKNITIQEK